MIISSQYVIRYQLNQSHRFETQGTHGTGNLLIGKSAKGLIGKFAIRCLSVAILRQGNQTRLQNE